MEAMTSPNPIDRFSFVIEEVNSISSVVSAQGAQLAVLSDQLLQSQIPSPLLRRPRELPASQLSVIPKIS